MVEDMMGVRARNRNQGMDPFSPMGGVGFFGLPPPGARRAGRASDDHEMPVPPFVP